MKKLLTLAIFLLCGNAYALQLKAGTYELVGSNNTSGDVHYRGEVTITPQGNNYGLKWNIGSSQTQVGVGILHNDVLSVAYFDSSGNAFGVVSFHLISNTELEGKWSPMFGTSFGREHLLWKGY